MTSSSTLLRRLEAAESRVEATEGGAGGGLVDSKSVLMMLAGRGGVPVLVLSSNLSRRLDQGNESVDASL